MRTLSELFQLMLANQQLFKNGLCNWVHAMRDSAYISEEEGIRLLTYLYNHRVKDIGYWWTPGEITPRIKWLNEQIKIQASRNLLEP